MSYPKRSYSRSSRQFQWDRRSWISLSIIGGISLWNSRDFFYFDNGTGGKDWRIGTPQISLLTAHQTRSLADSRTLALQLVNRDRQLNGLAPLVEDPLLSQTAQLHAQDMLTRHYYAHVTPEGKTPTDRFAAQGGRGGVGENILSLPGRMGIQLTYQMIEQFQKSWMYSPGHRKNLLTSHYTRFGYGIAVDSVTGQVYAVQDFASPPPANGL